MDSRIERAAREEAAHAVVDTLLGIPVDSVCIRREVRRPAPGTLSPWVHWVGHCQLKHEPDWSDPRKVLDHATGLAAGLASEMLQGRPPNIHEYHSPEDDRAKLWKLAERIGAKEPAAFIVGCMTRAANVLQRDGGRAWDRVTVNLERKRRLSGPEVVALVHTDGTRPPEDATGTRTAA